MDMLKSFLGLGSVLPKADPNGQMKSPEGLERDSLGKDTRKEHSQGASWRR